MLKKQFTVSMPLKLKARVKKALARSCYSSMNGFVVGVTIKELERLEKKGVINVKSAPKKPKSRV